MRALENYFRKMVDSKASDLYFTAQAPVQIKVDGIVGPLDNELISGQVIEELAREVMNEKQFHSLEKELEANFAVSLEDLGRFRINVFYQRGEMAMVIRFLQSDIPSIEELGLPVILKELVMEPRGLFLVVGTTSSGKSTTLASMIDYRSAQRTGHILTIEDPIEYRHVHRKSIVNQREVGIDTLNYASALKNAVREAPDVIMIGEIRDAETMKQAIAYADTGHLCLSTLHANNTYQGLERAVNFFPQSDRQVVLDDLAMNIRGIFSQRLLNTVDGKRIPACELMLPSPFIKDLIRKGEFESIRDHMEHHTDDGMITFEQSVFDLFMANKISKEEALKNVDSKGNFQTRLRLTGAYLDSDHEQPLKVDNNPF